MGVRNTRWLVAAVVALLAAAPVAGRADSPPAVSSVAAPVAASAPAVAPTAAVPSPTPVPAAAPLPTPAPAMVPAASGVPAGLLPKDLSVGAMFHNADSVVKAVLVGLIVASIITWTLLLGKGAGILLAQRSVRRSLA
ncbi:MAG TPA: hypothetical protein VGM42_08185, partial [Rhodopila sp.]